MAKRYMELPPLHGLVRVVAELSAGAGCLVGGFLTLAGFSAIQWSLWAEMVAMAQGVAIIVGSLSGLGLTYGFLAMVEAAVDMRNAAVRPRRHDGSDLVDATHRRDPWLGDDNNAFLD